LKGLNHSVPFTLKYEERLGLIVLIASLLVASVIIGLVFKLQHDEHRSRTQQKAQYLLNSFTARQHDTENLQVLLEGNPFLPTWSSGILKTLNRQKSSSPKLSFLTFFWQRTPQAGIPDDLSIYLRIKGQFMS
jgi:hypothetical protein